MTDQQTAARAATSLSLDAARAELAELAARVSPINPRADRAEVTRLYRLRRTVIELEAELRRRPAQA